MLHFSKDLDWRISPYCYDLAYQNKFHLAPTNAPRIAILLYRKHVITNQRYINDLIKILESQGLLPIPVFINGVEAHTVVRDWLTSEHEVEGVKNGCIVRDSTYKSNEAVNVDGIVSTIGECALMSLIILVFLLGSLSLHHFLKASLSWAALLVQ